MRAATSLPTPLSPSSSTLTVEGAMSARRRSACSTVGTTESEPVMSSAVVGATLIVRKRRNVSPISIQSPSSRTFCGRRSPLIDSPFLLPRSRTCQPPSERSTTACSIERCGSGKPRRSVADSRRALASPDRPSTARSTPRNRWRVLARGRPASSTTNRAATDMWSSRPRSGVNVSVSATTEILRRGVRIPVRIIGCDRAAVARRPRSGCLTCRATRRRRRGPSTCRCGACCTTAGRPCTARWLPGE